MNFGPGGICCWRVAGLQSQGLGIEPAHNVTATTGLSCLVLEDLRCAELSERGAWCLPPTLPVQALNPDCTSMRLHPAWFRASMESVKIGSHLGSVGILTAV